MDIVYDGTWGYHPLVLTLANTGEVLWLENSSGNRPSHKGAATAVDRVVAVCRKGGFRKVVLRGDTDFSQSQHLDRWDRDGVQFLFGFDATSNLREIAEKLPAECWQPLRRRVKRISANLRDFAVCRLFDFGRLHKSLRVSPAMQAGIADHV
jgi:hypothetical protein